MSNLIEPSTASSASYVTSNSSETLLPSCLPQKNTIQNNWESERIAVIAEQVREQTFEIDRQMVKVRPLRAEINEHFKAVRKADETVTKAIDVELEQRPVNFDRTAKIYARMVQQVAPIVKRIAEICEQTKALNAELSERRVAVTEALYAATREELYAAMEARKGAMRVKETARAAMKAKETAIAAMKAQNNIQGAQRTATDARYLLKYLKNLLKNAKSSAQKLSYAARSGSQVIVKKTCGTDEEIISIPQNETKSFQSNWARVAKQSLSEDKFSEREKELINRINNSSYTPINKNNLRVSVLRRNFEKFLEKELFHI